MVGKFHTAPVPVNVQVPEPMVIVRVLELFEENNPTVTLLLLALKIPEVRVNIPVVPLTEKLS